MESLSAMANLFGIPREMVRLIYSFCDRMDRLILSFVNRAIRSEYPFGFAPFDINEAKSSYILNDLFWPFGWKRLLHNPGSRKVRKKPDLKWQIGEVFVVESLRLGYDDLFVRHYWNNIPPFSYGFFNPHPNRTRTRTRTQTRTLPLTLTRT
jgi:hypothetical protein